MGMWGHYVKPVIGKGKYMTGKYMGGKEITSVQNAIIRMG